MACLRTACDTRARTRVMAGEEQFVYTFVLVHCSPMQTCYFSQWRHRSFLSASLHFSIFFSFEIVAREPWMTQMTPVSLLTKCPMWSKNRSRPPLALSRTSKPKSTRGRRTSSKRFSILWQNWTSLSNTLSRVSSCRRTVLAYTLPAPASGITPRTARAQFGKHRTDCEQISHFRFFLVGRINPCTLSSPFLAYRSDFFFCFFFPFDPLEWTNKYLHAERENRIDRCCFTVTEHVYRSNAKVKSNGFC